jgi:hypothetical protein
MPTYSSANIIKPKSWEEFEEIVCSAAKSRWGNPDFTLHGRMGQAQSGVDVYGEDRDGELVGIQCKNTDGGVTAATIQSEIEKAEQFSPTLAKLYIATTADTDKNIQAAVRALSAERRAKGLFGVHILFWTDIWNDLCSDEGRLFQHYPQLRPQTLAPAIHTPPTHDQRLFNKFKEALAFDPAIRLLRDHDFGGSFSRAAARPLMNFVETWDQPEHEFLNAELQAKLKEFYASAYDMAVAISQRTVPIGSGDFASVYSDQQRNAGPRSEDVIEDAAELNKMASAFVPMYESFLRFCRLTLEA